MGVSYRVVAVLVLLPLVMAFNPVERIPPEGWPRGKIAGPVQFASPDGWVFSNSERVCQKAVRTILPYQEQVYIHRLSRKDEFWSSPINLKADVLANIGATVFPVIVSRVSKSSELGAAWAARIGKYEPEAEVPAVDWLWRAESG